MLIITFINGCTTISSSPEQTPLKALLVTHLGKTNSDTIPNSVLKTSVILRKYDIRTEWINYDRLDSKKVEDKYDLFIILGSSIKIPPEKLTEESKLIVNTAKPLFGICHGFQQIVLAFGGKRTCLEKKARINNKPITIKTLTQLGLDFNTVITGFESHRWIVTEAPAGFDILAWSDNPYCIEIIIHRNRPLCGTQFHPEINSGNNGYIVLEAFIKKFVLKSSDY